MFESTGVVKSVEIDLVAKTTGNLYSIISLFFDSVGTKRLFIQNPAKCRLPVAGQRIRFRIGVSDRGENAELVWNEHAQFEVVK